MSETPQPPEAITPNKLALVSDHLYHALFQTALTAPAYEVFRGRLSETILITNGQQTDLIVQLMFADPSEEDTPESAMTWIGYMYNVVPNSPSRSTFFPKGVFWPDDLRDLSAIEQFAEIPTIVLTKEDIAWGDITEPVHGPNPLEPHA